MKTKFYLIVSLGLYIVNGWAQNQNWIFGNGNWIEFKNNQYSIHNSLSSINAYEVSSSISDKNGQLVMYSDSRNLFNAKHQLIENGENLRGHFSSTSMALVNQPLNPSIYYVFTVEANYSRTNFLCYSVVDMNLNNGLGKVIKKNIVLHKSCDEKIAITTACNSNGYWIVAHIARSAFYMAYKLDQSGLSTNPVISQIDNSFSHNIELGYLKFSPNGEFLANAKCHQRSIDLNQFDNNNGKITSYGQSQVIDLNYDLSFYGLSFSPNSQLLYASYLDEGTVYQYDLRKGKNNWQIAPYVVIKTGSRIGAIQLTPLQTIWLCGNPGSNYLHSIEQPNQVGKNCLLKPNAIKLNGTNYIGLPSLIESIQHIHSGSHTVLSKNATVTIKPCSNASHYEWSDGSKLPSLEVNQSGLYTVKLLNAKYCVIFIDSIFVEFTSKINPISSNTIIACSNTQWQFPKLSIDNQSLGIYWKNSSTDNGLPDHGYGQLPALISPTVQDTQFSQIYIYASNNIRSAYATVINLIVVPSLKIEPINDQTICFEQLLPAIYFKSNFNDAKITWTNLSPSNYIANKGDSFIPEKQIVQLTNDEYHLIMVKADHKLCPSTESSFKIRLIAPIHIEPVRDVSICGNEQLKSLVFKSNKVNYPLQWQNTQTELGIDSSGVDSLTQDQMVNPHSNIAGQIMVFNTNNGCPGDSIYFNIQINSLPVLKPIADTLICSRQIFNGIKAETAYANDSIVWQSVNTYLSPNKKGNNPLPAYYIPAQQQLQYDQYTFVAYNKQCVSDTITTRVYYQISPKVLPVAPPDICSGDWQKTITLKCSPSPAIAHWNTFNAELIQTNGSSSIPAYPTSKAFNEKEQIFIARAEYEACFGDTTHIKFNVHATPKALFTIDYPSAQEDIIQYAIQLNNQSIGADSYEWDFGDNTYNQGLNPTHVYEKNTSYTVQLYVQNNFACSDTMTQKTAIFNNNQFFIPNAFSPNGDQFNETIQIHGITNEASSFRIFNRWGELIYETQNNSPWDGNYQNQVCMQGVYMYIANIQSKHKGPIELRGSLTLLK